MIKIKSSVEQHPVRLGAEISSWLKEHGYVHDQDFTWSVDTRLAANMVFISFRDPMLEEQLEMMFKLKWNNAIRVIT